MDDSAQTEHPTLSYPDSGLYPIRLIAYNRYNCTDTSTQKIRIEYPLQIYIPNAFTPNSDNLNDLFAPKGLGIKQYSLQIFTRWGEQIHYSDNIGWDANQTPSGIYLYLIKTEDFKGQQKIHSGLFHLLR